MLLGQHVHSDPHRPLSRPHVVSRVAAFHAECTAISPHYHLPTPAEHRVLQGEEVWHKGRGVGIS